MGMGIKSGVGIDPFNSTPKGKSSTERATALIALAHPQFRNALKAAAKDMHRI